MSIIVRVCVHESVQSHTYEYRPTGQMTFGPGKSSSPWCIQVIVDTLTAQGLPHEVLDAEQTTRRFPVLKQLPSDYKCVVEEHAGILRASKALEAFQVLKAHCLMQCGL